MNVWAACPDVFLCKQCYNTDFCVPFIRVHPFLHLRSYFSCKMMLSFCKRLFALDHWTWNTEFTLKLVPGWHSRLLSIPLTMKLWTVYIQVNEIRPKLCAKSTWFHPHKTWICSMQATSPIGLFLKGLWVSCFSLGYRGSDILYAAVSNAPCLSPSSMQPYLYVIWNASEVPYQRSNFISGCTRKQRRKKRQERVIQAIQMFALMGFCHKGFNSINDRLFQLLWLLFA